MRRGGVNRVDNYRTIGIYFNLQCPINIGLHFFIIKDLSWFYCAQWMLGCKNILLFCRFFFIEFLWILFYLHSTLLLPYFSISSYLVVVCFFFLQNYPLLFDIFHLTRSFNHGLARCATRWHGGENFGSQIKALLCFKVYACDNFSSHIKALLGFRVSACENFDSQIKVLLGFRVSARKNFSS